jgi:hypothetical protein
MAADNTLVQASFKEAISGAGADVPNLKPLYDSAQAINKSVFGVINTFMTGYAKEKETQRVGKARQMSGFQKQSDDLVATMYAQDEPLPEAFMMAAASHIKDLQDEFEMYNTIGKGDTQENSMARARIMGELTRAKNKIINFRAGSQIFLEGFKDVNEGEVNGKKIAGQQQALDFKNYGGEDGLIATGKVEVNFGKNGFEITSKDYETVVSGGFGLNGFERREVVGGKMVVSLESLNKNFPQTNKEHHAGIIEDHTIMLDQGTGDGKLGERNYNEEIQLGKWVEHVNTPEKFRNMVSSSIKGVSDTSFKQHLESNLEIPISVLDNMYYDDNGERVDIGLVFKDLNKVDDGVINEKDREGLSGQELETFNQNVDALIDALTNVDNPAFDIGKSSKMLGQYLNQNTKVRYDYNYGIASKANINNGATGSQIIYANSNLGEKSFVLQDDILDKAMKNETIYSWGGDRFDPDPKNPGNYIQEGTDISKPIDGLLRGKHFGLNERINSRKLEYPTGLPNVLDDGDGKESVSPTDFDKLPDGEETGLLGPLLGSKFKFRKVNGEWFKLKITPETMYGPDDKKTYTLDGKATQKQINRIKQSYNE